MILFRFAGEEQSPSIVGKKKPRVIGIDPNTDEGSLLARLGPAARSAGMRVPRVLHVDRHKDYSFLLETMLGGRMVSTFLASQPNYLVPVLEQLVTWIEQWNRSTMRMEVLESDRLKREIIAPAIAVLPGLEGGMEYLNWLHWRSSKIKNMVVPFVATHNDLTMYNVVRDQRGCLGVIDWETAREAGYPLADFSYAVTDAVLAAGRYADRLSAFAACFTAQGRYRHLVSRFQMHLQRAVPAPDEWSELCFHACWLQHAANEHQRTRPGAPRPFRAIVQSLIPSVHLVRSRD